MALTGHWKPSRITRPAGTVRLIVLHTTEGAQTKESLSNWFSNPAAKVSSHVGIDNRARDDPRVRPPGSRRVGAGQLQRRRHLHRECTPRGG